MSSSHRPAGGWNQTGRWRQGSVHDPAKSPWRRLIPLLILLLPLIFLVGWSLPHERLSDLIVTGPRGTVCELAVFAIDQSGSMAAEAPERDAALTQVVPWLGRNARDDDQVAVIDFANGANLRLPATPVRSLPATLPEASPIDAGETHLEPAMEMIDREFSDSACDVDVFVISDGLVTDLPGSGDSRTRLQERNIHDLRLLMPDEHASTPPQWQASYPDLPGSAFDGGDPDQTAIVMADAFASCTGQSLQRA